MFACLNIDDYYVVEQSNTRPGSDIKSATFLIYHHPLDLEIIETFTGADANFKCVFCFFSQLKQQQL